MTAAHIQRLGDITDGALAPTSVSTNLSLQGGPRGLADATAFAEAMQRADRAPITGFSANAPLSTMESNREITSAELSKALSRVDLTNLPGSSSPQVGSTLPQEALRGPFSYQEISDQSAQIDTVGAEQSGFDAGSLQDQIPFEQVLEPSQLPSLGTNTPSEFGGFGSGTTLLTALADSGGKIDVSSLRGDGGPIAGLAERQIAQRDQLLGKVSGDAGAQINPVAIKQLEMRMGSIEEQQKLLGRLTGVNTPQQSSGNIPFAEGSHVNLTKPFSTFFGFITNGEQQLFSLERELASFAGPGASNLSPVDMLRIQVKMSHVSQQLELFTSMLNKGLESSKTVLNTQI